MKGEVIQLANREQIDLDLELTAYVAGNMNSQDKLAFEARLVNDKQLQQKLADEIEFKNQFVESRSELPSFNFEFSDLDEKIKPKPTRQYSLLAASMLVVISAGYLLLPNTGPDTAINQFETLTANGAGTSQAPMSYTLVFNAATSFEDREQILNELRLERVTETNLQGLQEKRVIVKAEEQLSEAQLELIRSHQKIIFFEASSEFSEQ